MKKLILLLFGIKTIPFNHDNDSLTIACGIDGPLNNSDLVCADELLSKSVERIERNPMLVRKIIIDALLNQRIKEVLLSSLKTAKEDMLLSEHLGKHIRAQA